MATDDPLVLAHVGATQEAFAKFNFYFTGLAFTLLGLAVQTAAFGANIYSNTAELAGWLLLLVSGLTGLGRLRRLPALHHTAATREQIRTMIDELRDIEKRG